ncbi:hypothetical protein C8Q78DRAFT_1015030 [Trametes maxima]|nr:hypothetical protein C8Q78DRAFT_1015030 [Trametes maxima]
MKFFALSATLAALVGSSLAQLEILTPGGDNLWWVAQSDNVITWTCKTSPYTNFTVLIANSDPKVLVGPQAFIAQQNNFDCSELITKDRVNMPVGTGYTIQLANPFNETDVSHRPPPGNQPYSHPPPLQKPVPPAVRADVNYPDLRRVQAVRDQAPRLDLPRIVRDAH